MTLTFLFVYCFLCSVLLQDFAAILPIISTGHFIAYLTLYQMLDSGKDISLHQPDDHGNVSFREGV